MSQLKRAPWIGSTEGISNEVLPPWTPVEIRKGDGTGITMDCWGRTYSFDGFPFPFEVLTAGEQVLSSPVRLRAVVDGQEVAWSGAEVRVEEKSPAVAEFSTRLAGGGLTLSGRTGVEYDGMIRVHMDLQPAHDLSLDELALEIPLKAAHAKYVSRYPDVKGTSYKRFHGQAIPQEPLVDDFCPYFWLGDEDRGLAWFCESDENWFAADPDRVTEIRREGEEVILSLTIVSAPTRMAPGGGLSYTFGLHATPVKPNEKDVWDWRIVHAGDYGIETLDPEAPATLRYPAEGNINLKQGTVELFARPLFNLKSPGRDMGLFSLQFPKGDEIRWYWPADGSGMRLVIRHQQDRIVDMRMSPDWEDGRLYHLALTWGDAVRIYRDGVLLAEQEWPGTLIGSPEGGVIVFGGTGGHVLVDEIRISDIPRCAVPNAPPVADEHTLLLDHLDQAFEPGCIEHLDSGYGGYSSTLPEKASGDWGWRKKPGGIVGFGRFREGRFGNGLELGLDKPVLDHLADLGVRTICLHEQWTEKESYMTTMYAEKLRALIDACHERGMQVLVYYGFLISDLAPEWPEFGEECMSQPKRAYDPYDYLPQPHQIAYHCCYRSVWQDALADGIAKLMDEYGFDGVYLDGTANPILCANRLHGCGYVRPDGSIGETYTFFANREMMKRIYTIVKTRKPEGQVNVHQSMCVTIPTMSWATGFWNGEQFSTIEPGPFALETIPLDAFRVEFMGQQWGVPGEFLCYDRPYTYEQACSFALLHDVLVRANGLGPHLELESKLWRLMDEFGRRESEWLPYWKNDAFVKVKPGGAFASLYRHPSNGVLAVISNLLTGGEDCRVEFNLQGLGLPPDSRLEDALTGETLLLTDNAVSLHLGSLEWRLLRLRT